MAASGRRELGPPPPRGQREMATARKPPALLAVLRPGDMFEVWSPDLGSRSGARGHGRSTTGRQLNHPRVSPAHAQVLAMLVQILGVPRCTEVDVFTVKMFVGLYPFLKVNKNSVTQSTIGYISRFMVYTPAELA